MYLLNGEQTLLPDTHSARLKAAAKVYRIYRLMNTQITEVWILFGFPEALYLHHPDYKRHPALLPQPEQINTRHLRGKGYPK